jgi:hypothetical protein
MTSKWDVVAALKKSGLLPSDRIIMMMLVDVADAETAYVAEQWSPSLTELARWTGLGRSTVAARLDELERLGWVKRERPATAEAIARGARTCYHLTIGASVEKAKPSRPANPTRTSPAAGPVQASDQVTTGSPDAGLVQPLDEGSPTAGLPLVQPLDSPSPAAGHKNHPPTEGGSPTSSHQEPTSPPSPPPAGDAGADALFETDEGDSSKATGKTAAKRKKASATSPAPALADFPITDAMRAYAAEKCPNVVADLEFHTEQFLNHHSAKGTRFKSWPQAWQTWIRNEQQWGRTPGRAAPSKHRPYQDPPNRDTSGYRKEF